MGTTAREEPKRAQRTRERSKERSSLKKLQGLEGTQGAPRKAVAEEAGRVRESGDKLKTGHHLVYKARR